MLVAGCALAAHSANSSRGRGRGKVEANALRALRLFSANYWHIPSRTALSARAILSPPPPLSLLPCCVPSVNPLNKCRSISLSVFGARTARQSATKIPNVLRQRQKMNCPSGDKRCQGGESGAGETAKALLSRKIPAHFFIEQLRLSDATRTDPSSPFPT